jgi:hypothetical protein
MTFRTIAAGAIAGAAGEIALNVVSYTDMLVRARPSSQMPGKVAERLAGAVNVDFAQPGERPDKATIRQEASGALLGYGMAIGTAVAYAMVRRAGLRLPVPVAGLLMGGAAMAVSDSAATALGVTDPTEWGVSGWLSDIVPHAVYGVVAAVTIELIDR